MNKPKIFKFANSIAANAVSLFGVASALIGLLVGVLDGIWMTAVQYIAIGIVLNVVAVFLDKFEANFKAKRKKADSSVEKISRL